MRVEKGRGVEHYGTVFLDLSSERGSTLWGLTSCELRFQMRCQLLACARRREVARRVWERSEAGHDAGVRAGARAEGEHMSAPMRCRIEGQIRVKGVRQLVEVVL